MRILESRPTRYFGKMIFIPPLSGHHFQGGFLDSPAARKITDPVIR